jgi:hypothetical protein
MSWAKRRNAITPASPRDSRVARGDRGHRRRGERIIVIIAAFRVMIQ